METHLLKNIPYKKNLWLPVFFMLLLTFFYGTTQAQVYGTPTRTEAENGFDAGVITASTYSGYSGSGYVTGLTTTNSQIKFDNNVNGLTPTKIVIAYANGTGASVINLALYVGSNQKIQDLVFPSTGSWTTWGTITVTFNHDPSWGSNIIVNGTANITTGVNIDYFDVSVDDGTAPATATPTFSPAAGTYTSAQAVTISDATSGATIYYTTDGTTPTTSSTVYSTAVSVSTSKTVKAIATASGHEASVVGSATYTINVPTAATPTFSPAAGTYTSTQSVTLGSSTSGATIYYTTDNSTPTTSSTVYSAAISVAATKTIKAIAIKSGLANSSVASATYTITAPPPAPGTFTQTTPATGATGISATPTFTWGASSNAATYTLVVSTSSSFTSPVINTSGIAATSYTSGTSLAYSTQYYWKVTAVNSTSPTTASNAGLSFTTGTAPAGQSGVTRQYWANITGADVASLTNSPNYPNSPTSTSILSTFEAPTNVALNYGQRVYGYLTAPVSGTYHFWIASDDNSELWLSTNGLSANKLKIASVTGWTNPEEWTKYSSQASTAITLVAGTQYYIEALMKQDQGGDNLAVSWQIPGGSQVVIPGSALSTALTVPVPAPGSFTQSGPANAATGVSVTPAFSWAASTNAASYSLVVSTSASYTSPVINISNIYSTSYTPGTALAGNTQYYWKVTATNTTASTVASNAGISFTTLIPPAPGAFTQTTPAAGATGVNTYPAFTWASSSNAVSYALVVSTSSSFTSPLINVTGLTSTSYSPSTPLTVSTTYYWKVTASNGTGTTIATNSGISFNTSATSGTTYYVSPAGTDVTGNGTSPGNGAWKTLAYAASQVPAGTGTTTISLAAGTYVETVCTILPLGVNIVGAGEGVTILTTNGVLPTPGVDQSAADYHLWADGSLIQLKSPIYSGANPRYGDPSLMIAAQNGNQSLSGFTIDGHNKTVKAGVWVENRNNLTMQHVTFINLQQSGAVFSRGDMYYYVVLPDGKWMSGTLIHDCTFTTSGSTSGGEQVGNLCLGGLDGAEIYNINITDPNGEGIKFAHVGHFRNTKIHDCNISVGETDPTWGEKISIELWNMSYNNEIYNIRCNTWLSMVNHYQLDAYQPTAQHPSNLKIHHVTMIDGDGISAGIESIECALSGVEIYNSYFQDKGFGIAIWGGAGWGGDIANHAESVHNNIFTKVNTPATFGFGNSAGVFVPDPANDIKIYNNVFDGLGNSLQLDKATTVDIRNNVFQNSHGDDIQSGSSLTITNNLRYNTDPQKPNWVVSGTLGSGNIQGVPGFMLTGNRSGTYYMPSSASSLVVNKGVDVGFPFVGSAPDIGRWEFGQIDSSSVVNRERIGSQSTFSNNDASGVKIYNYPNPTRGLVTVTSDQGVNLLDVLVLDLSGKPLFIKSANGASSINVDLSEQAKGVYLLRINTDRGSVTRKVLLLK
ncbi:chitobiase/beta-hexosaminidase C-terminal domain-containing protein [Flavitalea flava]